MALYCMMSSIKMGRNCNMNVPKCLSNISPRWAKLLDTYSIEEIHSSYFPLDSERVNKGEDYSTLEEGLKTSLDISQFNCCIVGEAHNLLNLREAGSHENEYHCKECQSFSMQFYNEMESHIDLGEEFDEGYYEETIEQFCEHIGEQHPELIKNSDEVCEK